MKEKRLPNAKPILVNGTYYQSMSQAARAHHVSKFALKCYTERRVKRSVLQGLRVELVK